MKLFDPHPDTILQNIHNQNLEEFNEKTLKQILRLLNNNGTFLYLFHIHFLIAFSFQLFHFPFLLFDCSSVKTKSAPTEVSAPKNANSNCRQTNLNRIRVSLP